MSETTLNYLAKEYLELTLCKSRVDDIDIQWYTEGPFWRRTDMRYSRDYKILPDYEIAGGYPRRVRAPDGFSRAV